MSLLDQITVLILTYNEEANLHRTLRMVSWAKQILIVDSGSTDATLDIVKNFPQARVVTRKFDDFANQCNFGLSEVTSDWVLSLDADYELSPDLIDEIRSLDPSDLISGYKARFIYRVYGQPLRATLYPPRTVLYRRARAQYKNEGHGHRVSIKGRVVPLKHVIFHDDRKSLSRWFNSQQRYARDEADYLLKPASEDFKFADRIRALGWPAPVLVFLYTLFVKRCLFDGWAGWYYVLQRTIAEGMIAAELLDRRLRERQNLKSSKEPVLAHKPHDISIS